MPGPAIASSAGLNRSSRWEMWLGRGALPTSAGLAAQLWSTRTAYRAVRQAP